MPFQNLWSSWGIELSETFPLFAGCTWMGHTREVAGEHYVSVPAEHITRAIAGEIGEVGREEAAPSRAVCACRALQDTARWWGRASGNGVLRPKRKGCDSV